MDIKNTIPFFLFGMGDRKKMIFCNNCLFEALSGKLLYCFGTVEAKIIPEEYRVVMGDTMIFENGQGVFLKQDGECISLTEGYLNIPEFEGHPNRNALRILFHEIVMNIVDGKPVPNLFVYKKPWYRDSVMMCMILERTGNLHLVYDWIMNLREPYDRNNADSCEADCLGQALYLISLVSDKNHPLVERILYEAGKWKRDNYIAGITDGSCHAVYQTLWLKYGLKSLGLPDPYEIPDMEDSYEKLFWMDPRRRLKEKEDFQWENSDYPYLEAAKLHYDGVKCPVLEVQYPLTWEKNASQANYNGNLPFFRKMCQEKLCAPHTWHAAEMYLWMEEI